MDLVDRIKKAYSRKTILSVSINAEELIKFKENCKAQDLKVSQVVEYTIKQFNSGVKTGKF